MINVIDWIRDVCKWRERETNYWSWSMLECVVPAFHACIVDGFHVDERQRYHIKQISRTKYYVLCLSPMRCMVNRVLYLTAVIPSNQHGEVGSRPLGRGSRGAITDESIDSK